MIAKIEKKLFGGVLAYEFDECDNLEDVREKYKHKHNVEYIGEILRLAQIENLNRYGNTVISNTMLEKLGDKAILKEVKRLTGYRCNITVMPSGTVILNRV